MNNRGHKVLIKTNCKHCPMPETILNSIELNDETKTGTERETGELKKIKRVIPRWNEHKIVSKSKKKTISSMVEWQTDKEIAALVFYFGLSTCQLNSQCSMYAVCYGVV